MLDAARAHVEGACNLAQEMRGRFTFDGGIGRKNEFAYVALGEDRAKLTYAELLRSNAIERRQMPHEHEVAALVAARLFDGDDIRGRLDDAQERRIALRRCADEAVRIFGQHAAASAAHDACERRSQGLRQRARAAAAVLQQMKGHALRALGPDPRQCFESVDEARELWRMPHVKRAASFPAAAAPPPSHPPFSPARAPPHDGPRRSPPPR